MTRQEIIDHLREKEELSDKLRHENYYRDWNSGAGFAYNAARELIENMTAEVE